MRPPIEFVDPAPSLVVVVVAGDVEGLWTVGLANHPTRIVPSWWSVWW
jgi:hypothetical protein